MWGWGDELGKEKKIERKTNLNHMYIILINYTRRVITPYICGCLGAAASQ